MEVRAGQKKGWAVKIWFFWTVGAGEDWRFPWTARISNQSILKEISPEYSLVGLMLKLKLQYFDHLMRRSDSFEKPLILGKMKAGGERDDRGWDGWMASLTQWTWLWVKSGSCWWTGRPGVLHSMGSQRVRQDWTTELNRTELSLHIHTQTHTHTHHTSLSTVESRKIRCMFYAVHQFNIHPSHWNQDIDSNH